jgi:hypothetical protein
MLQRPENELSLLKFAFIPGATIVQMRIFGLKLDYGRQPTEHIRVFKVGNASEKMPSAISSPSYIREKLSPYL